MQSSSTNPGSGAWVGAFAGVIFAMLVLQMASLGFSPLLPDIQDEFRISYGQLGLFTGVYGIIGILLSVPAGLLARKYGEKPVLLTGLIVVASGLALLASAPDFLAAFSGRVVWLAGYRLAFVCVMMAAALTAPPKLKGSTMGVIGAVSGVASVVGAPFAGEMGRAFGWRIGIAGYAALALAGAAIFATLYKPVAGAGVPPPHGAAAKREGMRPAHREPVVWVMACGIGLLNMGGFTITFFVHVVLGSVFHLSSTDAAFTISAAYLAAIFVNLLVGYLADRLDRMNVMIALGALVMLSSMALISTNLLVFRIAAVMVVSLGHTVTNQGYARVGTALKGRETGPAMGIMSLGAGVYAYLGPQMIGLLRDSTGTFLAGFQMLVGAAAVGLILMLLLQRSESRCGTAEAVR